MISQEFLGTAYLGKRVFDDNRFEHNSGGIRERIVKESRSN